MNLVKIFAPQREQTAENKTFISFFSIFLFFMNILLFNLLDITALNAYNTNAYISISISTRRDFIIKLDKSLSSAEKSRRPKTPHLLRSKRIRQKSDEDFTLPNKPNV